MNDLEYADSSRRGLSRINIHKVRMESSVAKWRKGFFGHIRLLQNVYFGGRCKHAYLDLHGAKGTI